MFSVKQLTSGKKKQTGGQTLITVKGLTPKAHQKKFCFHKTHRKTTDGGTKTELSRYFRNALLPSALLPFHSNNTQQRLLQNTCPYVLFKFYNLV